MNNQLKKGLLDLVVLSILKDNSTYGYDIVTKVNDYLDVKESSIYIVLQRLTTNDYLSFTEEKNGARKVKVYSLTKVGIEYLESLYDDMKKIEEMVCRLKGETNE